MKVKFLVLALVTGCAVDNQAEAAVGHLDVIDAGPAPVELWTREWSGDRLMYKATQLDDGSAITSCSAEDGPVSEFHHEPESREALLFRCQTWAGDVRRQWEFWIEEAALGEYDGLAIVQLPSEYSYYLECLLGEETLVIHRE